MAVQRAQHIEARAESESSPRGRRRAKFTSIQLTPFRSNLLSLLLRLARAISDSILPLRRTRMSKCYWSGRKERAGRRAGPSLGSFLTVPENPRARKVVRPEFLFGGSQACSPIIRETSRLCIDSPADSYASYNATDG